MALTNNTTGASIYDLGNVIKATSIAEVTDVLKDAEAKQQTQQQQQMQAEIQMNNTVNELRGTYKMSDNDIQDFLNFTTKPKEKVGLNSLVKLWQMENGQHFANNDTVEAVSAAKQAPRTAGVLQGQAPQSPKSDQDKVWDTIMGSGRGGALP